MRVRVCGMHAEQVQRCPDPEAWAAALIARPDFTGGVLPKFVAMIPSLDSSYLTDSLVAFAALCVADPRAHPTPSPPRAFGATRAPDAPSHPQTFGAPCPALTRRQCACSLGVLAAGA